jgi:RND family efflux transporter MFP subunit
MSQPRHARVVRVWLVILFTVLGILVGAVGGAWLAKHLAARGGAAPSGTTAQNEQLYTCGMHPQVIQKGPGNCPICGMKLTPLKSADTGGSGGMTDAGPKERKVLYWRAPMDPNYISEKPGKSPMGMDLVPVYADEGESPVGTTIRIDPVTIQNMGIRTTTVTRGPLVKSIRTVGRVDYDEQLVTYINMKFNGWIEKLFVNETGQHVRKGQPLFDVYSPELYSAQEEYLAALRGLESLSQASESVQQQSRRLLEAAQVKLKYLDISDEQIDELKRTKQIHKTLTLHSPAEGIVTEKMALEGMYVNPGMKLYTIADLSRVWVYMDIYEYELPWIRVGQPAAMSLPYVPGKEFAGKVVYIYPYLEKQTRVIKVRLEFENPELELKPEMYANVTLSAELGRDAILVPREAYIDSGKRQVAFLDRGGGKFQPREIQIGVEAEEGMVEVLSGLDEGDVVVTSGQFLLDGESKLREAIAKMTEPGSKSVASGPADSGERAPMHAGERANHEMSMDQDSMKRHAAPASPAVHAH